MYQMILFLIVIYKKFIILLIFTKRYQIAIFFSNFLGGTCSRSPLAKGMASLSCDNVQRIALTHANLHFRKIILTPQSNSLYPPGIHVQINQKYKIYILK